MGLCNVVSAGLIMKIGWELYGRLAGLIAGLLFVLNIGWAQGYFVITEPFTVTFVLLATYFAFCGSKRHYFLAGLSVGIAIGFKQYALITVPLLALSLYLNKELKHLPALIAGVLLPLVAIFGAIYVVYGWDAFNASMYWSWGIAGSYIGESERRRGYELPHRRPADVGGQHRHGHQHVHLHHHHRAGERHPGPEAQHGRAVFPDVRRLLRPDHPDPAVFALLAAGAAVLRAVVRQAVPGRTMMPLFKRALFKR